MTLIPDSWTSYYLPLVSDIVAPSFTYEAPFIASCPMNKNIQATTPMNKQIAASCPMR